MTQIITAIALWCEPLGHKDTIAGSIYDKSMVQACRTRMVKCFFDTGPKVANVIDNAYQRQLNCFKKEVIQ